MLGAKHRSAVGPVIQKAILGVLGPHGFGPDGNSGAARSIDGLRLGIGLDWTWRRGDPYDAGPALTVVQPEWYRAAREILLTGPDFAVGEWRAYRMQPESSPFALGLDFLGAFYRPRPDWRIPIPPTEERIAEVAAGIRVATAEYAAPYFARIRDPDRLFDAVVDGSWTPFGSVQVIAGALLAGRHDVVAVLLAKRGTAVRERLSQDIERWRKSRGL